jgi:predicted NAD/FAD-binding protein
MPKNKKAWSSWVYLNEQGHSDAKIFLSYWMNNLQKLNTKMNYFVTVNPQKIINPSLIIDVHDFEHPYFDHKAIKAQQMIKTIQGKNNTFYAGAYLRYGFHEDGILSAVNIAKYLGYDWPWKKNE